MINDLGELKKLLSLCRKQGITEIELGTIKIKFGELPSDAAQASAIANEVESDNPYANFPDGILTPEQLTYYSSGGIPDDDPGAKAQ